MAISARLRYCKGERPVSFLNCVPLCKSEKCSLKRMQCRQWSLPSCEAIGGRGACALLWRIYPAGGLLVGGEDVADVVIVVVERVDNVVGKVLADGGIGIDVVDCSQFDRFDQLRSFVKDKFETEFLSPLSKAFLAFVLLVGTS